MTPTYITIHDTGNSSPGADAKSHANYVKTTDLMVSWHYTVDDQVIYQHLPSSEVGWHAGDGNGTGNMSSVGVEICMNSDGDRQKAEEQAMELTVYLMKKYSISLDHVVQHNKWSGKDCPQVLRNRPNGWVDFKEGVKNLYEGSVPEPPPEPEPEPQPDPDVPQWQIDDFNNFVKRDILNNPEVWIERLGENITIGEMFSILERTLEKTYDQHHRS